jgi:hypothetical protein
MKRHQTIEEKVGNALGLAALLAGPLLVGFIIFMRRKR